MGRSILWVNARSLGVGQTALPQSGMWATGPFAMARAFLLLLFSSFALSTRAQRLPFFNLSIESGLAQSQATCLAQDKLGRLWIGTLGGLSCYDGASFTTYSARDGLPSGTVMSLAAHPDGSVWAGTTRGLVRFNGRHFSSIRFPKISEAPPAVPRLVVDGGGRAWCLSGGKVFRIVRDSAQALQTSKAPITALAVARNGAVLFGSGTAGIFRIEKGEVPRRIATGLSEPAPFIQRIFESASGEILLLATKGLLRVDQGIPIPFLVAGKPLPAYFFTSATQAPDGSLWLGTRSGALRITDTSVRVLRRRDGLSDNLIYEALTDREGHLWLASDGQGLFRFSGSAFETVDESAGLPSAQVMAIAANKKGTLFFGTYDAGLFSYYAGKVSAVSFPDEMIPSITALAVALDSTLWIGTRGAGLWTLKGRRLQQSLIDGGPSPQGAVGALFIHPQTGELYASLEAKASVLRAGRFETITGVGAMVQDFLALGTDSLLLATVGGLKLLHSGKVALFKTGGPADSAVPQCITRRGHELWIGTADKGVLCFDTRTRQTTAIDRADGLRSDFVYNLVVDRDGAVWAGTGNGIHRIRLRYTTLRSEKENGDGHKVQGTLRRVEPMVQYFGKSYGVTGMESNQRASLMMPDGSLWFGTTAGAVHYKPGAGDGVSGQIVHRAPVSLALQNVQVAGTDSFPASLYDNREPVYGVPTGLRIPWSKRSMTVRFHAVSLGGPEEMLYRYRLDDASLWSAWSPEATVTFSALPPGRHVLEVECSTDGRQARRALRYPFVVETPFHRTPLFYVLIGAVCIGAGVGLQALAARRRRAHDRELEELRREEQAKVRQRTAEDFHDEVGNTITRMTVLTSVLQSKVKEPEAVRIIEQIRENAGRLYSGTRDILWSLKPGADNLWEILHRIRDFGQDLFGDTDVQFVFSGSDERWRAHRLSLDWSRNLTMIFKEALNNALKYAGASRVELSAVLAEDNLLTIRLRDNGKGFDTTERRGGHGLQNMRTRAGRLGGIMEVKSEPGAGTELTLRFKIPQSAG